jgi:hypothetical protein
VSRWPVSIDLDLDVLELTDANSWRVFEARSPLLRDGADPGRVGLDGDGGYQTAASWWPGGAPAALDEGP